MTATGAFFNWYFAGLGGIGGWFVFMLLALVGVVWLIYDTQSRRIRAVGWLMSAILIALLLTPTLVFSLVSGDVQARFKPFQEVMFYLGLLGGILPLVIAVGYLIAHWKVIGCERGHTYATSERECPICAEERRRVQPPVPPDPPNLKSQRDRIVEPPPPPRRDKINALLIETANNQRHELCRGDTRAGRGRDNDIALNDPSISREHFLIREDQGHLTLYDRGSKVGTWVNGRRVDGPVLLQNGDEITVGDTVLKLVVL